MAWRKANNPTVLANGTPRLTGEAGEQVWKDDDNDVVFPSSAADFPKAVEQTTFMGIPVTQPAEGSIHSLLLKISADVAAIKNRLQI